MGNVSYRIDDLGFIGRYLTRKCTCDPLNHKVSGVKLRVEYASSKINPGQERAYYSVTCSDCGAQSRSRSTPARAMVAWDDHNLDAFCETLPHGCEAVSRG